MRPGKLYFTGRSSARWQDVANWSRTSGGPPCGARPSPSEQIVVDENSGSDVDLFGAPSKGLSIHEFKGRLVMPNGGEINFAPPPEDEAEAA